MESVNSVTPGIIQERKMEENVEILVTETKDAIRNVQDIIFKGKQSVKSNKE